MIGSPERVKIQRSSIPKIRKIHSCVWKLQDKNYKNSQFWPKMAKFLSYMAKILPYQNFPGMQSMTFSKKTIRKTSIPKIRNNHSGVWKLQAQNSKIGLKWTKFRYSMAKNSPYQNFLAIQSMISSKKTIRTTSIPKIGKIHSSVWKLQVKTIKNESKMKNG